MHRFVYELHRLRIAPDAGADRDYRHRLGEIEETPVLRLGHCNRAGRSFGQRLSHELRGERRHRGQHARRSPANRAQSRSHPQRSHAGHRRCSRFAERASHDQRMTIHALVAVARVVAPAAPQNLAAS